MLKVVHHDGTRQAKEPDAPQRRANAGLNIIDGQGPLDADHDALAVDRKLPAIKQPRRLPKQDAPEILQVPRLTRSAILVEELRRADDDERFGGRQPHRDHVHLDDLRKSNQKIMKPNIS
jgi:hypothetical protein